MKPLPLRTIESAPDAARPGLVKTAKTFGFVPSLMATMANSAPVLNGYLEMFAQWEKTSLTLEERTIVLLTASIANSCEYCTAGYSNALKHLRVDAETIRCIRQGSTLQSSKLDALVRFTRTVVRDRGLISEETKQDFLKAGYTQITMMEILMGVALKTLANYLDHINPLPIDEPYLAEAVEIGGDIEYD